MGGGFWTRGLLGDGLGVVAGLDGDALWTAGFGLGDGALRKGFGNRAGLRAAGWSRSSGFMGVKKTEGLFSSDVGTNLWGRGYADILARHQAKKKDSSKMRILEVMAYQKTLLIQSRANDPTSAHFFPLPMPQSHETKV